MNLEAAVGERYSRAARAVEPGLCCPVEVDPKLLQVIPERIVACDYGCGDPVRHVHPGETVLDLGSGSGKGCFVAAQLVGPEGRVIGIDMNQEMLTLAREAAPEVAQRLGYGNVAFHRARVQDLKLDLESLSEHLRASPITDLGMLDKFEGFCTSLREKQPLVPDGTVDVVISNCVLNLVESSEKRRALSEIHRVLRPGGRAVLSDIVTDQDVPAAMQDDVSLWSGCYSGALREDRFINAVAEAGLHGACVVSRSTQPWQIVEGVAFRSVTLIAYREADLQDVSSRVLVYKGPFRRVEDDDGHVFVRGIPKRVESRVASRLAIPPYRSSFYVELSEYSPEPCGPSCQC